MIIKIRQPTAALTIADYGAQNNLIGNSYRIRHGAIESGSAFRVKGELYKCIKDVTITGTPSAFVELYPSGRGLAARYVGANGIWDLDGYYLGDNLVVSNYYQSEGTGTMLGFGAAGFLVDDWFIDGFENGTTTNEMNKIGNYVAGVI